MVRRRLAALALVLAAPALVGCPVTAGGGAPAPADTPAWVVDMLAQVNAQRSAAGVHPLGWCGTLSAAAQGHSADQAQREAMSHTGGDGSDIAVRANRAGYAGWAALGENVGYGYGSVATVMAGWLGSPGHRDNLLSPSFTHVGFGLAVSAAGTPYWTQDFGAVGTC